MKTWTPSAAPGGALACFVDSPVATPTPLAIGAVKDRVGSTLAGSPGSSQPVTTIVVGVDRGLDEVVAQAGQRATAGRTRIVLVHAHSARSATAVERDRMEQHAAAATAALRRRGFQVDYRLQPGRPADVLAEAARELDADTIVIGCRPPRLGRRSISRVARALDRCAPCQVVLVASTAT